MLLTGFISSRVALDRLYHQYSCSGQALSAVGMLLTLNVHGVSDVRQAEIHTAEPLVPEPNALEVESAIEKLKSQITRY